MYNVSSSNSLIYILRVVQNQCVINDVLLFSDMGLYICYVDTCTYTYSVGHRKKTSMFRTGLELVTLDHTLYTNLAF